MMHQLQIWYLVALCLYFCNAAVLQFEQIHKNDQKVQSEDTDHETDGDKSECGYSACNLGKPDMLNVHLVPHTHDDVGWLKTVDQYYYGAQNQIQHAGVQYILDTVIQALLDNPERRFIYVEIAYFYRWWNEQHDYLRHQVIGLVKSGRLEFILGGWCMNDEASTHYNAIIDQHTVGFQFLKDVFGECARPKIGWQIDPFGHSREQASLFAQFGFDGLFFGRLDYQDKDWRMKNKTAEMMWMGSDNLGDQASLFTGVNYNGYGPPGGLCFDNGCADKPIMDDSRLEDYNVDDVIKRFVDAAKEQAMSYTTNHIMFTMGSDFQFENAHMNFKNLDKLINYVNQKSGETKINTFYSTPSCYLNALNKANKTYTSKQDDFFPYASRAHTFWTGYFTSRPALKGYVRQTNNFLQVVKQLDVLAGLDPAHGSSFNIDKLRQAMGVAQHHDAVSGTEKQAVADDYARRLAAGVAAAQETVNEAYGKLLPLQGSNPAPTQSFCPLANVSVCDVSTKNDAFTVTLYNPLGRALDHWVQLPVYHMRHHVYDDKMTELTTSYLAIDPAMRLNPTYKNMSSGANWTLTFKAYAIPALGFRTFFVTPQASLTSSRGDAGHVTRAGAETPEHSRQRKVRLLGRDEQRLDEDYVLKIETNRTLLVFDDHTGYLQSITNKEKNLTTNVSQILMYYKAFAGNNSDDKFQASGAYAFRPNGSDPEMINLSHPDLTIEETRLGMEMRTTYSDWAYQTTRLYNDEDYVEIEWSVGPIPISDGQGKEVINKIVTDFKAENTFYTDANGREMLKRVIDFRPTWMLNQTEPVAGNYYPVNSRIAIQDKARNLQLTVLTDRSQGGGSVKDGELELMVHRRLLCDDAFGAGEPLNETEYGVGLVVRGKHYLFLDRISDSGRLHRNLGERLFMAPALSLAPLGSTSPQDYAKKYRTSWSGLKRELPANVHLLTLEEFGKGEHLLRLEHFYEKGEDTELSKDATVSLKDLFAPFEITQLEEMTLGGNSPLTSTKRLAWNVQNFGTTNSDLSKYVKPVDPETLSVLLRPMQIRTFRVTLTPRN